MIYHLVCWDLPLVLLLEVKAQWTLKNRKLESLKIEEKGAETVTEIGIEGSEMEIEGQVKDGRIEVTGEVEDEMIEVEMTEEGHPDLEEMMIEDTEEIPDGEEMMRGETGMVETEIEETEEEMTGTEEKMLVLGFKAWLMVDQCRYLTCLTYHGLRTCQDRRRTVQGVSTQYRSSIKQYKFLHFKILLVRRIFDFLVGTGCGETL